MVVSIREGPALREVGRAGLGSKIMNILLGRKAPLGCSGTAKGLLNSPPPYLRHGTSDGNLEESCEAEEVHGEVAHLGPLVLQGMPQWLTPGGLVHIWPWLDPPFNLFPLAGLWTSVCLCSQRMLFPLWLRVTMREWDTFVVGVWPHQLLFGEPGMFQSESSCLIQVQASEDPANV